MRLVSDLISAIKTRQSDLKDSLAGGYALNIESYNRMVGQYAGLQESLDILERLMDEENDE
jgi:hypothetical protein